MKTEEEEEGEKKKTLDDYGNAKKHKRWWGEGTNGKLWNAAIDKTNENGEVEEGSREREAETRWKDGKRREAG